MSAEETHTRGRAGRGPRRSSETSTRRRRRGGSSARRMRTQSPSAVWNPRRGTRRDAAMRHVAQVRTIRCCARRHCQLSGFDDALKARREGWASDARCARRSAWQRTQLGVMHRVASIAPTAMTDERRSSTRVPSGRARARGDRGGCLSRPERTVEVERTGTGERAGAGRGRGRSSRSRPRGSRRG